MSRTKGAVDKTARACNRRTVSAEGAPFSEGCPVVRTRVSRECALWLGGKPPGWLRKQIERIHLEETCVRDGDDE